MRLKGLGMKDELLAAYDRANGVFMEVDFRASLNDGTNNICEIINSIMSSGIKAMVFV